MAHRAPIRRLFTRVFFEFLLMSTEIFTLSKSNPDQTVTFEIWPGTGRDFDDNLYAEFDDVTISWTGENGLPIADVNHPYRCSSDRASARDIYAELLTLGYKRNLIGSH